MFKYLEECLERKDLEKNPVVTYGNHVSPGGSGKDKWGGGEGDEEGMVHMVKGRMRCVGRVLKEVGFGALEEDGHQQLL